MATSVGAASAAPVLSAAVNYAARGWRVFPLHGKVPLAGTKGCHGASADPNAVAFWPSGVNVGVATGNGLVVLDVDYIHDGGDALAELERRHGELAVTVSVETGGGGAHYYFGTARGARVGCSVGKLGRGLDVRGDGGYVVAPPSIHPETARAYTWDNPPDVTPLARLPRWLERSLADQSNGHARPVSEWRDLAANGVHAGARNDACARLAGHLLARSVDPFVTLELVLAWNVRRNRPPLADDEAAAVVRSIARKELEKWGR
jgi:hypothetical protein